MAGMGDEKELGILPILETDAQVLSSLVRLRDHFFFSSVYVCSYSMRLKPTRFLGHDSRGDQAFVIRTAPG